MSAFSIPQLSITAAAVLAVGLFCSLPSDAQASALVFDITANGLKEVSAAGVPNQGDPDGTAIGTLRLDNGTGAGTTGTATFSITLSNIDLTTLAGHHIHIGAATTTGAIVLDFGDPDNIRTGSVLTGTVANLSATQITSVFANPTNFYYNLHNGAFPGGAVRSQIPEPGSAALLVLGMGGLLARRSRRV